MHQHLECPLRFAKLYQRHCDTMQRSGMIRKLGQAALEQRYRSIVTLRQLTHLRGEVQLLHRH
jgi:hypothetical protein